MRNKKERERRKERRKETGSLNKLLSERVDELPPTIFHQLQEMAAEEKGVISLGPGEPDFDTPKHILDFVKENLYKGYTHYSAPGGRSELKKEIGKKLKKDNGIKLNNPEDQIVVTCGSTESLLLSLASVLDPTEEVLVPNPGYFAYAPMAELIDAQVSTYSLSEETGFQPNPDEIKKKVKRKTMAIIINSPSNPTGTVFKHSILEEIADIAVDKDLMIITDEAYEKLVYGNTKHHSIASFNGLEENVISNFSFSKTYAMAGFRIGFATGPEWLINNMTRIHLYSSISAPTISQIAALGALKGPQGVVEKMRKEYGRRREMILKRIDEIEGLDVKVKPDGAFYAFPRFDPELEMNSLEFSEYLIKKGKVITIPGSEFGSAGDGFLRLSYATGYEFIEKAMDSIDTALRYGKL